MIIKPATCVLLILILLVEPISAQQDQDTIPFQLTAFNNISITAVLNKKDTVHLMFHTAAFGMTLTEEAVRRLPSLRFNGTDSVKSWGGSGNASRYSEGNALQVGGVHRDSLTIWENRNSGPGTDGKFGPDFFESRVIEIDFSRNVMIISTSLPPGISVYEKLKLTRQEELLFVDAACSTGTDTFKNSFLLHSGYSGEVLLDDAFVSRTNFGTQLKVLEEKKLTDSYGNVLKTKKAIMPVFLIGGNAFQHVSVEFFEGAIGRQKMSIIGGGLLKRFDIIIDAAREYLYIKHVSTSS